jgi:hypothetical protein
MVAVGLLGLEQLAPRVLVAMGDGRIPRSIADESDFRHILEAARERPADKERFEHEGAGYIEDVLESLQAFAAYEDDPDVEALAPARFAFSGEGLPAHNPYRHVGRNEPCPCGSGKKFKKCHGLT